jgi:hypothetical protein
MRAELTLVLPDMGKEGAGSTELKSASTRTQKSYSQDAGGWLACTPNLALVMQREGQPRV